MTLPAILDLEVGNETPPAPGVGRTIVYTKADGAYQRIGAGAEVKIGGDPAGSAAAAQAFAIQRANHTGTQLASTISDFTEAAQDATGALLANSNTIRPTYNDAGNAEALDYVEKYASLVTGASKTYVLADIGLTYERSNAGAAMTDTLPTLAAGDNGWTLHVHNTGTTPAETIVFTSPFGTFPGGASTYTLNFGCRQTFIWTGTKWLFGAGNGNLTKVSGAIVANNFPKFNDSTGRNVVDSGFNATSFLSSLGSLRSAGAVGDGTADDRPAFVSLDGSLPANYGILVTAGRYRVGSNLTITRPLAFNDGGRIVVPTGVTITINAPITAGIEQIFELEGTGVVVVSPFFCSDRFAEWWGAVLNADCAIPFAQCIKSGTRTLLQARDYNTTATMTVPAYATVQGAGYNWEGTDTATRVLMIGGTNTIVQLGSTTASPPDLNSAPCGATVYDVYFGRNAAPNAGSIGAYIGWSRSARMERCRVTNSLTNYKVKNAISPFLIDLFSKRDTAIAAAQGADSFVGYDIDGTGALPAAGGNASVWLTRPQVELNLAIAGSTAYWVRGRFTDTFVTQPECLGTDYGIDILGDKGGAGQAVGSNCNLVIENPVVDQTKVLGIRIRDVNQWGTVHILQPYCGPATGDAITASNCDGHVGISTGQMRMNVSTSGKGITFDGCRSPQLTGTVIAECSTQALVLNNTAGGQFTPVIQNVTATLAAAVQAVANVTKSSIRPSINGAASKVSIGYQSLASSNAGNNISTAAIATGVVVTPLSYAAGAEVGSVYPDTAPIVARKTANQAMTLTGQTAVTDLAVNLEANATYNVEISIAVGAVTGTTPTMAIGLTGPASPTTVLLKRDQMNTATSALTAMYTAFAASAAVAQVANTVHLIKGLIVTTAAGTLQVTVAMAGTTPNATIVAGSSITANKINVP